ncbi:hypothetical protein C0132_26545 (plasmid) [Priestia aryabhattai]
MRRDLLKKILFILLFLVFFAFIFYYAYTSKTYNFDDIVNIDKKSITKVEIKHDDKVYILKNKREVNRFVNALYNVEVKKSKRGASGKGSRESYWVRLFKNDKESYGLTIYDNHYLDTYHFSDKKLNQYKIVETNNLMSQLEDLSK